MDESALLKLIRERSKTLSEARPDVLVGPGDDCALVAAPAGGKWLITVDQMIEGRHFTRGDLRDRPEMVARKAIARSVSDIAAMAGTPAWALATAALPAGFSQALADLLFEHMHERAQHWGCPLVGGDLATLPTLADGSDAPVVMTITVAGTPHEARGPVLRSGAKVGDDVYVTGRIGGSLPSARHLTFEPRLVEAKLLADTLGARLHAMLDVSDGLGRDAGRIAAESGVRLEIDAGLLPLHEGVPDAVRAARDGEDYELLFTAAPAEGGGEDMPAFVVGVPNGTPTMVTRIGRVVEGSGCVLKMGEGAADLEASALGWNHS